MIYISGMEDGSGSGEAASRKAGWLPRAGSAAAVLYQAVERGRAAARRIQMPSLPAPPPAPSAPPDSPRPALGADGRPLPPDGSAPPRVGNREPGTGNRKGALYRAPATGSQAGAEAPIEARRPALGADGRPLPPDGSRPPERPVTGPIATPTPHGGVSAAARNPGLPAPSGRAAPESVSIGAPQPQPQAGAPQPPGRTVEATRVPGTPLPPGTAPTAPFGHSFVSRPVAAPPGEFLFDVRCSCGAGMLAPVKLDDLRGATTQGRSPAVAIATATQDALDRMHSGV